jgi:isopentenyl-diphosphate Delta-isomerase
MPDITSRKNEHLDLTIGADVGFRKSHLLDCVELMHDALPELSLDDIDTGVQILGKHLCAPIIIAAMTGGSDRARDINLELASIAEEGGYGFGVGSQRAMLVDPLVQDSYSVRQVAPTCLILGNLGAVQAARLDTRSISGLIHSIGADALCIHLNPAMELVQPEGDRDFRGILMALERINRELAIPVVAKETGCGLSPSVARRLLERGITHVDVSGAGGTSWVAVESERLPTENRSTALTFRDWGIPTAASVAYCASAGMSTIIATGGIVSGLDIAKAVALGAHAAGLARPVLKALHESGRAGAIGYLKCVENELRMAMLLTRSRSIADLRGVDKRLMAPLSDWIR